MTSLPVALLDAAFAKSFLIDPTFSAAGGSSAIGFESSAFRLFANHLDMLPFMDTSDTRSIFVVIVNRLAAPVTVTIDVQPSGDLYFGTLYGSPTYRRFDTLHRNYAFETPNEIPAARKADGTVGVGALAMIQGSMFYGTGGAFSLSTSDPNLEGATIYAGCQNALGDGGLGVFGSVAISDDAPAFSGLRDFYDKNCDIARVAVSTAAMAKGAGNDPAHGYELKAAMARVDNVSPGYVTGLGTLAQFQAVITLEPA